MKDYALFKVILKAAVVIVLVAGLSQLSIQFQGGLVEKEKEAREYVIDPGMTVARFGQANGFDNPALKELFGLQTRDDLERTLDSFGMPMDQILRKVEGAAALTAEHESKDWKRIFLKFGLWILFIAVVFRFMKKGSIRPGLRKGLYVTAALLFGVVLGSDPSAMGTVKDAIVLFVTKGVVFPPRLIALSVFLLMVLVFNKSICSWGCQAGVLQDLLFRLNRDGKDTRGQTRQFKPSFALTNGIRILFLAAFTAVAVLWGTDLIEFVDPFKVYKPAALGVAGMAFVALLLLASAFVYRPWCHFLCPFGLVGWLVEKVSLFRIKVNYDTCIACEACARACPSTVMEAILKRDRTIPDCFACANCIDVCPTDSVCLDKGKRDKPPEGKFGEK